MIEFVITSIGGVMAKSNTTRRLKGCLALLGLALLAFGLLALIKALIDLPEFPSQ